jgi:anti-sigma factor RsiW
VEAHLLTCGACRRELTALIESREAVRSLLSRAGASWREDAWSLGLSRAAAEARRTSGWKPWPFRPVWAYALMALLAAGFTFMLTRPIPGPKDRPGAAAAAARVQPVRETGAAASSGQDIVAVTLVSRETGLKVQWFFNRNFKLKEETE